MNTYGSIKMHALPLKVSAPVTKHTSCVRVYHVVSTGKNIRPGWSPRESHSFHPYTLRKPLLCVSGTILGFVDTSVKKKKIEILVLVKFMA